MGATTFAGYRFAAVAITDNGRDHPAPVEIAVAALDDGVLADTVAHWVIRPTEPITAAVTRACGITNDDVARAPALPEVADEIRAAIGDRILLAHRGRHCLDHLTAALPGWAAPSTLDTRRLSVRVWPTSSRALGVLLHRADITGPGTLGRADHDAPATAHLFLHLARRLRRTAEQVVQWATLPDHGPTW